MQLMSLFAVIRLPRDAIDIMIQTSQYSAMNSKLMSNNANFSIILFYLKSTVLCFSFKKSKYQHDLLFCSVAQNPTCIHIGIHVLKVAWVGYTVLHLLKIY
jgi:hypothetical protein